METRNPLFGIDLDRIIDAGRESQHQATALARCLLSGEFYFAPSLSQLLIKELTPHIQSLILVSPNSAMDVNGLSLNKK